jgi:hypothetical protein
MMERKIWTWIFIIILLAVYIFAACRTNQTIWGYICAIDFAIIFLLFVKVIETGKPSKAKEDEQN